MWGVMSGVLGEKGSMIDNYTRSGSGSGSGIGSGSSLFGLTLYFPQSSKKFIKLNQEQSDMAKEVSHLIYLIFHFLWY